VEFGWAFHIENTHVFVLACDAPEMHPLPLQLQFLRALVLLGTELFNLAWVRVMRDPDGDVHVEQHVTPSYVAVYEPDSGLWPVILCNKASAYSDAADWSCPVINLPSMTTLGVYGFVLV
jgi:hypothetical protein